MFKKLRGSNKSLKVLLENLLRYEDDLTVDKKQILAIKEWLKNKKFVKTIEVKPIHKIRQRPEFLRTFDQVRCCIVWFVGAESD